MTGEPLVLAVPSKGRLQENAAAFFARAGLPLTRTRGGRDYTGAIAGMPDVEVLYLSAGEIVTQLAGGGAHLGITGEDLIREAIADVDAAAVLIAGLGFGYANVVVATPQAWIDVRGMSDLDDVADGMRARHGRRLRVATKYLNLTRRFFSDHGIVDYRIVESLGATEAAPSSGTADLIVDITTTGATLAANGLKVLDDGVILRSEARLIGSLRAYWGERARNAAGRVLARIAAEERARTTREVRADGRLDRATLVALAARFAAVPAGRAGEGSVVLHCPADAVFDLIDALIAAGGHDVTVRSLDYVFGATNPLADALFSRLPT